jgi:uncharacterized protein
MQIAITGSSGLVGSAVVQALTRDGYGVKRLVRSSGAASRDSRDSEVMWDAQAGRLDTAALDGVDTILHLAGETISERWNQEKKARIRDSRLNGTRFLAEHIAAMRNPPKVLISASAVGYYGDRGDERLTESSAPGSGFLAEVCRGWEAATAPASQAGIRTVLFRLGVVLSRSGGALPKMLPPFRMGVGGKLGSGRQYMSWITIDDVVGSVRHILTSPAIDGPVNAVAPNPVTNAEFTKALGAALHRPTIFPVPELAVRLAFGEMGQQLLLASQRVIPEQLTRHGYRFQQPEIEGALRSVLG